MTSIHHGLAVGPTGLGAGATDKTQSTQGQGAALQTPGQPGSEAPPPQVQITPAAQLLANVDQQLAHTPEVDQGRVDAIRQALSQGTYQLDSGRVANGVLAADRFAAQVRAK